MLLMDVVSRRRVWLECIGVVLMSVVVRRYNYRYPHKNYYFSLLHSFFGSIIPIGMIIIYNYISLFI